METPRRDDIAGAPFDELLSEVLHRVKTARDEQVRWQLLLEAVVTMAAGLSLDQLLSRIVDVARDLAGAKYAALGVVGTDARRRLRLFVTSGLTDDQIKRIGDLPEGHGLLGLLIDSPEAVRLHDIADHPKSYGFPANHPSMHSFLGVPVRTAGRVFGNLYLAEKNDGHDFTEQDEAIVTALAAAAGVAIENARLHEDAARREQWLGARSEVMSALMSDAERLETLQLVADRAREIASADAAWIMTGPDADSLLTEVVSGADEQTGALAASALARTFAGVAIRSGGPLTLPDVSKEGPGHPRGPAELDLGPAVVVPLHGVDESGSEDAAGILALAWTHANAERSKDVDLGVANVFAEQVALALRLARSKADQQQLALYDDRERIGRDLHDVVIQRLFAIGLRLQTALKLTVDPDLSGRLDSAVDEIDATIANIRSTIFELNQAQRPADLLTELLGEIDRAALSLGFRPETRFSGPIRRGVPTKLGGEAVAFLGEALSNVVRHAGATSVTVEVTAGSRLTVQVTDDGRGMPVSVKESGLSNMRRRAVDNGGEFTISSDGPGTVVTWSVPLG